MNTTASNSILTKEIQNNFEDYLNILTQNNNKYILCVPPNDIIMNKCEIDPKFIQEHILEVVGETEFRSLSGKNFRTIEHEFHLKDPTDKKLYCTILSTDLYYTPKS